jgi:pimeloyl-ACP methyl ester carboxylesterase
MGDLAEVREAMGYDKINVYGISYGTQAALEYLRQSPAHVRSVVLTGVATPAAKQPLHFTQGAQRAMDKLIPDCTADEACRAAFPNLSAEFAGVLAEFDKGPAKFEMIHPVSKERQPVQMSRGVFVEALRLMLYNWVFVPQGAAADSSRSPRKLGSLRQSCITSYGPCRLRCFRDVFDRHLLGNCCRYH